MDLHEIMKRIYRSFFVIWSLISLAVCLFALIFDWDFIIVDFFLALFFVAFLTSLTYLVFYSRVELSIRQLVIRTFAQFILVLGIAMAVGYYVGWITPHFPVYTITTVVSVLVIFIAVTALEMFLTWRLADKLNIKLKERSEK